MFMITDTKPTLTTVISALHQVKQPSLQTPDSSRQQKGQPGVHLRPWRLVHQQVRNCLDLHDVDLS